MIPQAIHINNYRLESIFLFLIPALIAMLFVYWHEMRRDGFDEEKAVDLFIISTLFAVIFSRVAFAALNDLGFETTFWHVVRFWTTGNNFVGALIGFALPLLYFPRAWNWSFYRVSDIFALTLSIGISVLALGMALVTKDLQFLLISFWYLVLFQGLFRMRLRFGSGLVFSLFLFASWFVGLKLYVVLLIIGIVSLYYRERKNPMSNNLPAGFISKIKTALKKKDKELEAEQKLLMEEDPYMVEGRDDVDEIMDDVSEDIAKRENQLRQSSATSMRASVRKALAKIKLGKYGICEVCGEPIGVERLKAYPEATTCVKHSS